MGSRRQRRSNRRGRAHARNADSGDFRLWPKAAILRRAFEVRRGYKACRDRMIQISRSGSLSDNEMNIVWLDPAVGTSNQQAMRCRDHGSRGNKRAGAEAQVSVRHIDPSNGRPGPFSGGTGNRLLGATNALGWLSRGLAGVGTLGVHESGGLSLLNEGCASVAAMCKKL